MQPKPPTPVISWTEVRVLVPMGWQELVAAALDTSECTSVVFGATSIGMEPPPDDMELVRTYITSQQDEVGTRNEIQARLSALASECAAPELEGLTASFRCLPPEEYASSWRKSWKPFRVGKLCVLPTWYEGKLRADDLRMTLEPGGSFGSGRHATTRTCLRVLGERVKGGETVLDAGSGSGILAVAATLFGAGRALGFDIDPNSKMYGDDLARQNKVSDRVTFRTGDFSVLSDQDQDFDFVLANIYSDVIQSEVRNLMDRLALGGCFMFSGCPQHHRDNTRRAILNAGLVIEEERQRGRWITFVGLNSQTQA